VGSPLIPEGGGKTAMIADHSCPEDTGMDTFDLKVVSLKTPDEIVEYLHSHAQEDGDCQKVRVRMPVSSRGYVVDLKILAFTY
jgi:hypothetical protein